MVVTIPSGHGMENGFEHSMANGFEHSVTNGFEHSVTNGFEHSMTNGFEHSVTNGLTNGSTTNGLTNGLINGLKNALMNGSTNGHATVINGLTNGSTNGHTNGLTNGSTNGHATKHGSADTYVLDSIRDERELRDLVQYAIDYAHCIGLVGRTQALKNSSDLSEAPPLSLFPSPFPRELYEKAISVQRALNELYFRVSMDHDFLVESYKDVVKGDDFIRRLMEMMEIVHAEGIHQKVSLCVQRADYLSHWDEEAERVVLKQVEVNIGQIGGPGCATSTSKLHRRMLDKLDTLHNGKKSALMKSAVVPENLPQIRMAQTFYEAWKLFGDPQAIVLILNEPGLFPICHFEQLQFSVFQLEDLARADGHRLNVLTMGFKECAQRLRLADNDDFSLYLDDTKKVALIHMGYGYLPEHYPTEKEWKMRLDMERSTAIVSPNIRLQLTGTKKIQQVLSNPGVLERFFPREEHAQLAQLRDTFIDLWGLESNDQKTLAIIQEAIRKPKKYVLKAQLGAGKGNYFDEQMAEKLITMSLEERGAYILQKRIMPVVTKNYFLRPLKPLHLENHLVSEMGIFGSMLGNSAEGKVLWNSVDGHLLRSKAAEVNQGGVSEGAGVVDSLLLFPSDNFHC